MERSEKHDLVDRYFLIQLDEKDRLAFEESLKTDEELAEIYELYNSMERTVEHKNGLEFLNKLNSVGSNYETNRNKYYELKGYLINKRNVFSWAAMILVLLSVGFYFMIKSNELSNSDLFNKFYASYDQIIELRGPENLSSMQLGMLAYQEQDYMIALDYFAKSDSVQNANNTRQFYTALCYMETGQYKSATEVFEKISENPNDYKQEVDWYLSLSYIMTNQDFKAKTLLEEMSKEPDHFYKEKARKALKDLKKLP